MNTTSSTNLIDTDFHQENLDFSQITPEDFENLVFHLLDEMGFSNLNWRKGGEGNSATDGGRDLEATYWSVRPAESLEEKYWFEVKHRSKQLEKIQVQKTVLNASGNNRKDNVVIITNKTISNPTKDWLSDFQLDHKTPRVMIWQGHDLELFLRKNPRTLAKFLPSSLAFSGRCKVIRSKFQNLMLLPSIGEVEELWRHRKTLKDEETHMLMIAVVAEVAYGDVCKRRWGIELDRITLFSITVSLIANLFPFIVACSKNNKEQSILIDAASYLLQCLLMREGVEICLSAALTPEEYFEDLDVLPEEFQMKRCLPIINTILHDLSVQCSSRDCSKVSYLRLTDENNDYFERFLKPSPEQKNEEDNLILNSTIFDCKLGLVEKESYCLFGDPEDITSVNQMKEKLAFAKSVILSRSAEMKNT
ncbi:restriction endonuclease [Vibrio parahaemolyticus]|uniref:restriction endonuclease n=2 Tax=Vibrio parahaemolyticus TaxID=670 RepID=UPI000407D9AC|nr:restriction endonuclease [Vibrio parahaemolyticus]WJE05271.1 restriction endonuclease [Vibrio parahaemolyticus]HCG5918245.1 restriction endonuclease [Vibrio parahaemolyticus]HCG9114407.1 restriction endonuclease [Vibrio parahaemolyticus]